MATMIAMTDADYTPRYSADHILGGQVHDFLKRELADPSVQWLIPRCQEGAMYPPRHPRMDLREQVPRQRGADYVCRGCVARRRRDQDEHR